MSYLFAILSGSDVSQLIIDQGLKKMRYVDPSSLDILDLLNEGVAVFKVENAGRLETDGGRTFIPVVQVVGRNNAKRLLQLVFRVVVVIKKPRFVDELETLAFERLGRLINDGNKYLIQMNRLPASEFENFSRFSRQGLDKLNMSDDGYELAKTFLSDVQALLSLQSMYEDDNDDDDGVEKNEQNDGFPQLYKPQISLISDVEEPEGGGDVVGQGEDVQGDRGPDLEVVLHGLRDPVSNFIKLVCGYAGASILNFFVRPPTAQEISTAELRQWAAYGPLLECSVFTALSETNSLIQKFSRGRESLNSIILRGTVSEVTQAAGEYCARVYQKNRSSSVQRQIQTRYSIPEMQNHWILAYRRLKMVLTRGEGERHMISSYANLPITFRPWLNV